MYKRRTWREKLADSKRLPKVGKITGKMSRRWGSGTMVVPAPMEVNQLMRKIPKGKRYLVKDFEKSLARLTA